MSVEVRPVEGKRQLRQFIDFPHDLYQSDRYYVPEIYLSQKELLNRKKNPFFQHSDMQLFLAFRGKRIVGRIAAIQNNNYNSYHQSNIGFFGFFDVESDYDAAKALLDRAADWCRTRDFDAILGPANPTSNDTMGLLVDGFDDPPAIMMTYNKAYFADFLTQYGFQKEMDLYAYMIYTQKANDRSIQLTSRLEERLRQRGISIRQIRMKDFKKEVAKIQHIYNSAWEKNWGFVPATDAEFGHTAASLKMVVDARYCFIAEKEDGEAIAFGLGLPDINQILIKVRRGRLFPFGIFKLPFGKKKVRRIRIVTLGVVEKYRRMGIEAILYGKFIQAARDNNLVGGEASWILESNEMMTKGAENLNGELYKTYRIYRLPL